MEMQEGSASAGGTVTMEISAGASAERAEPEDAVQRRGAAFPQRDYRILIVIGEIFSEQHLDAARKQIAQGERRRLWARLRRWSTKEKSCFHHVFIIDGGCRRSCEMHSDCESTSWNITEPIQLLSEISRLICENKVSDIKVIVQK